MFSKKLKIEIPKFHKCSKCKEMGIIDYKKLTHDNILVVIYKCDCGNEEIASKEVKFI